jgi:hypothetical protein
MSQVLEAPEIQQDKEHMSSTEVGISFTLPRKVMSFIRPRMQHLPQYAATPEPYREDALDHVCRTNPFLLAYSG